MCKEVHLVGRDEGDVWAAVEEEWVRVTATEIFDAGKSLQSIPTHLKHGGNALTAM